MKTLLEERMIAAAQDCELIRQDVAARRLASVKEGLDTVIRDLTELRNGVESALASCERNAAYLYRQESK